MRLYFRHILMALLMLQVSPTAWSGSETSVKPLSFASEIIFSSSFLKNPQNIHIYLPQGYESSAEHIQYPVIYTLDGWALSRSVSGVVNHLGNTASMPKAIVVAINSDDDHAYGPSLYTSKSGWGDDPTVKLDGFSGGQSDIFLSFLKDELIPYIDQKYRTNDFRILIGMSPSATITLHTFWKEPELFDAHFAFAATDVIGMGYTPDSTIIHKLAESLAKNPDRKGYLYVASAQREADKNPIRNENIASLKKALAPYTGRNFRLRAEHIENFGHYPMVLPGLLNALDLVFPRADWDTGTRFSNILALPGNAKDNLLSHFEKLSQQVGFTVRPNPDLKRNANSLRVASYRLRGQKRYAESEQLYRLWIKDSPTSPKAYAGLSATMEASGKPELALEYSEKAVALAKKHSPDSLALYKKRLTDLHTRLASKKPASP